MSKRPVKAYKNPEFMASADARVLRILAEYLEPQARFRRFRVADTIVFFGSARVIDRETAQRQLKEWEQKYREEPSPENHQLLKLAQKRYEMSRYYEDARTLARLLTSWSMELNNQNRRFIIVSGGGPGIMEAANRGAAEVPGGRSIGLNISIPTEQDPNPYITDELNFEFHYFFMRKFWFIYLAKALVVFPGGFGTMDELWEVLTLIQTRKVQKPLPVVMYGESFWRKVINFEAMVENLVIDENDLKLIHFSDSPEEAFQYLKEQLSFYLNQPE